jgi:hypothetical protein
VQEQAADSISQKPAEAAPTAVPSSREDQPLNAESRNENLVATAAAAWPISPNTEGTGGAAANANAVQLVDPNEVNELDRAAETAQAESSWSTYLLLLLGAPRGGIGHVVLSRNGGHFRAPSSKFAHAHEQPVK